MVTKFRAAFGKTIRTLHKFWLDIVGVIFLVFSITSFVTAVQEYSRWIDAANVSARISFPMAVIFGAVMLIFAVHTFWKARNIRQ